MLIRKLPSHRLLPVTYYIKSINERIKTFYIIFNVPKHALTFLKMWVETDSTNEHKWIIRTIFIKRKRFMWPWHNAFRRPLKFILNVFFELFSSIRLELKIVRLKIVDVCLIELINLCVGRLSFQRPTLIWPDSMYKVIVNFKK